MKLKSFKYFFGFLIIFSLNQLKSEDKIDIWKNNTNKKQTEIQTNNESKTNENSNSIIKSLNKNNNIKIEGEPINLNEEEKIFGLYDPADNNFDLNMWSSTSAEDVRASIKRLKK